MAKECSVHSQAIFFRFDRTNIDSTYVENRDGLRVLSTLFTNSAHVLLINSINIYAYSSPEGVQSYNEKLAIRRATSMKKYLTNNYPFLKHCPINIFPQGENWEKLKELVAQDENFHEREEVVMILYKIKDSVKREKLIRQLNGGKAYAYIQKNIFPKLRNATVCTMWVNDRLTESASLPSLSRGKGVVIDNKYQSDNDYLKALLPTTSSIRMGNHKKSLYLRTNLLHWVTLTPDIGLEWRIIPFFGIIANGMWTSWHWKDTSRHFGIWKVNPELRYYLGKRKKGYLGVAYHTGEFNFKFGETGKQGGYRGGSITGGYLWQLNKVLTIDFSIGAGYTWADYEKYQFIQQINVFRNQEQKNIWGINQAGVSLVWKLF